MKVRHESYMGGDIGVIQGLYGVVLGLYRGYIRDVLRLVRNEAWVSGCKRPYANLNGNPYIRTFFPAKPSKPLGSFSIWYFPKVGGPQCSPKILESLLLGPPKKYPYFWEALNPI